MRLSIVKESRSLRVFDPITQFAIEIWTDYGFSSKPQIIPRDESAIETWQAYWNARGNQYLFDEAEIQSLSNDLLTDGELFFVFFISRLDGQVTCRTIPTEEIKEIVTSPADKRIPVYYRRDFVNADDLRYASTVYYRDWRASDEVAELAKAKLPTDSKFADQAAPGDAGTDVLMLHAAFRKIGGRGWPLMTAGMDWSRAYRNFLQDRAAVARMAATFVEKIKAKNAGTRAIDAMKASLSSTLSTNSSGLERNPVPAAGSTWLENENVTREWMNRPTGASDAEKDGMPLFIQTALGGGLYPHYLGRGDYFRLATASSLEGPILKKFNRYQGFWSSIWQSMCKIVLGSAVKYGGQTFESLDSDISLDNILTTDLQNAASTSTAINDFYDRGLLDPTVAEPAALELVRVMMQSLGIDDTENIINPQEATIETGLPFAESADQYRTSLRGGFRGLWTGAYTAGDGADAIALSVNRYLKEAFIAGLKAGGIDTADGIDEDDTATLFKLIAKEEGYIDGVVSFIVRNNKASGGKWAVIDNRLGMWARGYQRAYAAGLESGKLNPLMTWREGPTSDKCDDCVYANGRTYRFKTWLKWGWRKPPAIGITVCGGHECLCSMEHEDGVKANKGHPRRPIGPKK